MRVYRVRRAPNPRGIRSDRILWFIGAMAGLYIITATIWTLLAVALTPGLATLLMLAVCAVGIAAAILRARQLDRRDAAHRDAVAQIRTETEEDPGEHTAPSQES